MVKLAKLPPMPRKKRGGGLPSLKATKTTGTMPGLPKRGKIVELPVKLDDEVEAAPNNFEDRKGAWIDPTEQGRWFETTTKDGSVGGRCGKCGRLRKAENLELHQLPFGQGEIWRCKGSCR